MCASPRATQTKIVLNQHAGHGGHYCWGLWVQSLGRKLFSAVTNAFNPGASGRNWVDPDIISIDLGLTMLMMENQRTGAIRHRLCSASAGPRNEPVGLSKD